MKVVARPKRAIGREKRAQLRSCRLPSGYRASNHGRPVINYDLVTRESRSRLLGEDASWRVIPTLAQLLLFTHYEVHYRPSRGPTRYATSSGGILLARLPSDYPVT